MNSLTFGFIGLGLIGGSMAKAIKHFHPDARIMAHTPDASALAYALSEHIIDEAYPAIDMAYRDCDYIFLCAPVEINANYLAELKPLLKKTCILTDVGSTKSGIHHKIEELHMGANFIGGHPMAGSEKSGIQNAKRHLIENAYYVLTPSLTVPQEMVDHYEQLIHSLKGLPLILNYEEHDYITAAVSHLPHLIAATLVNLVKDTDNAHGTMKQIAAGGFKDITRIASSSPEMWSQICSANRDNIKSVLDQYMDSLKSVRNALDDVDGSGIYALFDTSRDYRNSISDTASGPLPKAYSIYCDMVDEAGGIAALATILATNNISIKNIGIVHNREFEEAVLHVEFYESTAKEEAVDLLRKYRYIIYER